MCNWCSYLHRPGNALATRCSTYLFSTMSYYLNNCLKPWTIIASRRKCKSTLWYDYNLNRMKKISSSQMNGLYYIIYYKLPIIYNNMYLGWIYTVERGNDPFRHNPRSGCCCTIYYYIFSSYRKTADNVVVEIHNTLRMSSVDH